MRLSSFLLALLAAILAAPSVMAEQINRSNTVVIEPDKIEILGPWRREGNILLGTGNPGTAITGFEIPTDGTWHVWTLARDFSQPHQNPTSRRLRVHIDQTPAKEFSGMHRQDGWRWEKVLSLPLKAGTHVLKVEDVGRNWARLDSVMLTTTGIDPNESEAITDAKGNVTGRRPPFRMAFRKQFEVELSAPQFIPPEGRIAQTQIAGRPGDALAKLANADTTVRFLEATAEDGSPRIYREVNLTGIDTPLELGVEPLLLLHSTKNPRVAQNQDDYYPGWRFTTEADWQVGDQTFQASSDFKDPYASGDPLWLYPVQVRQDNANSVSVRYASEASRGKRPLEAVVTWTLPPHGHALHLRAELSVPESGHYSLAFGAGKPLPLDDVYAVQLPPMYQFQRVSSSPMMIASAQTPHPLALVETVLPGTQTHITTGVASEGQPLIPDPKTGRVEWSDNQNSGYGFSLASASNAVQPVVFTPVMGFPDSRFQRGEKLSRGWWTITAPGDWIDAMREIDERAFALSDYREPVTTSLTDQALNIIDLMRDRKKANWIDYLKGPFNIEAKETVTHSAPLMYLSVARLTRDEDFFQNFALPTFEYMLTRPGASHAINLNGYASSTRLDFTPRSQSSAVWHGANALLGNGNNPWLLENYAFPGGRPLPTSNPRRTPDWTGWLALYQQTPDEGLLKSLSLLADQWIDKEFDAGKRNFQDPGPFYNAANFYPSWWNLLDLYEATGNPRHLEAARQGAALTVAGQWAAPAVDRNEQITLYPGNRIGGTYHVWWTIDGTVGRMGWPGPMPDSKFAGWVDHSFRVREKTVPAWVVSPVGFGLEQPITHVRAGGPGGKFSNIQLSVWAPTLLRLYGKTGEDYWRTFARNSLIGRGANYTGYYLADYLDMAQDPDYPIKGPELNSFYWHHVPVHLAMVVDFLFTDIEVRTGGKVSFPYVRQQGYAWFSSRIYGAQPGRVLDDDACWPWLSRTAFNVNSKDIDFLGARSRNAFHLILLNQAKSATRAPIHIDSRAIGLAAAAPVATLTTAEGSRQLAFDMQGNASLELPENGWAILSFNANPADMWPTLAPQPEDAAPLKIPLGKPWGDLHAFRIRSPFGSDALYVALSEIVPERTKMELLLQDDLQKANPPAVTRYPYEATAYPLPTDRPLAFRLRLRTPQGKTTLTDTFVIPAAKPVNKK